jgi:hypothetical protein
MGTFKKIIGIGHRRRVGKNEGANFLLQHINNEHKGTVEIISFADKLKEMCFDLYGHYGLKEKEFYEKNPQYREQPLPIINKSPREIWIEFGNKNREIYSNIWVDYVKNKIPQFDNVIIPDVRWENEGNMIHEIGGYCVKIINPRIPYSNDPSDCALENWGEWDFVIENNGTLEEFYQKLSDLYKKLK